MSIIESEEINKYLKKEFYTTKEKLLRSTNKFLSTKSYSTFSLTDIASDIDPPIKKASIFHHFKSKADLGAQAILYRHQQIIRLTEIQKKRITDSWQKLEEFFDYFKYVNLKGICPGGALSAEYNNLPEEIKKELYSVFEYIMRWLSDVLEEGRKNGTFKYTGSSIKKSQLIFSLVEGAMLVSRTMQDLELYNNVCDQIKEILK